MAEAEVRISFNDGVSLILGDSRYIKVINGLMCVIWQLLLVIILCDQIPQRSLYLA